MEVIQQGDKTVECERCGCIMRYNFLDIRHKTLEVRAIINEMLRVDYINCPQCMKEIQIDGTFL